MSQTSLSVAYQRKTEIDIKIFSRCKTDPETNCWIWQGPTSGNGRGGGYPRCNLDGVTATPHIIIATHYHGYIPKSRQVDHLCNNRLCCNPEHLEIVTHRENQRRRVARSLKKKDYQNA